MDPADYGLTYLASPYTGYSSLHAACRDISIVAGRLIKRGYRVYSPIAHSHTIAINTAIDPLDHQFWLAVDLPFMRVSDSLMIAMMDGWKQSIGIAEEIEYFEGEGKPIYYLNPNTLKVVSK